MAQLVKNPPAMQETWVGKIPGGGKGNPPRYSSLENSMDCTAHGSHKESDRTERLSHYLLMAPTSKLSLKVIKQAMLPLI